MKKVCKACHPGQQRYFNMTCPTCLAKLKVEVEIEKVKSSTKGEVL